MIYLPRRPKKLILCILALIGNREAIEAKKMHFEHPRKRRTRRKEKEKERTKTMKENEKKME